MNDIKRVVIRGGFVTLVCQAAKVLIRMGSLVALARLLDPKDFGLVGMASVMTGVFEAIKDAGLSTVTVQRASISEEQVSTLFWLNLAMGASLALLTFSAAPLVVHFYHEPRLFWITAALSFGFILNALTVQHSALLQRQMRFVALAVVEILSLSTSTAIGIGMALAGYAYWGLVCLTLSLPAVTALCVWIATGWIPGRPRANVGLRSMLMFGGTITLNSLVVYVAYNFEKALLGRFWGPAALGLYGRAYQLIKLPTDLLNSSLGSVAFPALSRVQDDGKRFRSYFLKGYSLVLTLTVPLTIACGLFSSEIVAVFLGPKWKDSAKMFRLLAPTVLVFAAINPLGWLLIASGRVGRSLRIALVIAALLIVADLLGLSHGPNGVAFAYSTAMVIWLIPHMAWCAHGTPVRLKDLLNILLKPISAGIIAAFCSYAVQVLLGGSTSIIVKLASELLALVAVYTWILLIALDQKTLIINVARELVGRRMGQGSIAGVERV